MVHGVRLRLRTPRRQQVAQIWLATGCEEDGELGLRAGNNVIKSGSTTLP